MGTAACFKRVSIVLRTNPMKLYEELLSFNFQNNRAIVFIEELSGWADVTFPSPPLVVSLKDYEHVETSEESPTSGYPVICVTVRARSLLGRWASFDVFQFVSLFTPI